MIDKEFLIDYMIDRFYTGEGEGFFKYLYDDMGKDITLGMCENFIKVEYGVIDSDIAKGMNIYIGDKVGYVVDVIDIRGFIDREWGFIEEVLGKVDKIKDGRKYFNERWGLSYEGTWGNHGIGYDIVLIDRYDTAKNIISLVDGVMFPGFYDKDINRDIDKIELIDKDIWGLMLFLLDRYPYKLPLSRIKKDTDGGIILYAEEKQLLERHYPIFSDKIFGDKKEYKIRDVKKFVFAMDLIIDQLGLAIQF